MDKVKMEKIFYKHPDGRYIKGIRGIRNGQLIVDSDKCIYKKVNNYQMTTHKKDIQSQYYKCVKNHCPGRLTLHYHLDGGGLTAKWISDRHTCNQFDNNNDDDDDGGGDYCVGNDTSNRFARDNLLFRSGLRFESEKHLHKPLTTIYNKWFGLYPKVGITYRKASLITLMSRWRRRYRPLPKSFAQLDAEMKKSWFYDEFGAAIPTDHERLQNKRVRFYHGMLTGRTADDECLVWFSEAAFQVTKGCKNLWLFGDANHKLLPQQAHAKVLLNQHFDGAAELYVIHVAVPPYRPMTLAWFLCKDTKSPQRIEMFKAIRRHYREISSEPTIFTHLICDCDASVRLAAYIVFRTIRVVMCSWHYERAINQYGTKDGETKRESLVQQQLKCLAKNVCHLPDHYFDVGIQVLARHGRMGNESHFAKLFINYLMQQWQPISISVYNCDYITSNTSEQKFSSSRFVYRSNFEHILEWCRFLQHSHFPSRNEIIQWQGKKYTSYRQLIAHHIRKFKKNLEHGDVYQAVESFLVNLTYDRSKQQIIHHRPVAFDKQQQQQQQQEQQQSPDIITNIILKPEQQQHSANNKVLLVRLGPHQLSIIQHINSTIPAISLGYLTTITDRNDVSNVQCEFQWLISHIAVRDLDSLNGTAINGIELKANISIEKHRLTKKVSEWHRIRNGDRIRIGRITYNITIVYRRLITSGIHFMCTLPAAYIHNANVILQPQLDADALPMSARYLTVPIYECFDDVRPSKVILIGCEKKLQQSRNSNGIFKCTSIAQEHGYLFIIVDRLYFYQVTSNASTIHNRNKIEKHEIAIIANGDWLMFGDLSKNNRNERRNHIAVKVLIAPTIPPSGN